MKKKLIIFLVLFIFTLIIFLPPVIHGYIYPNGGDDSGFHIEYFERLANGADTSLQYLGQKIIGYPLNFISDFTHISIASLFMWFNFITLWLIGISYFVVLTLLINYKVGLLSIPMVLFITPSTLNLFDNGSIYDLITVGIVFPFLILSVVRFYTSHKLYWLIPLVVCAGLFFAVHTMGALGYKNEGNIIPTLSQFISIYIGYGLITLLLVVCFYFLYNNKWMITKEIKGLLICSTIVIVALVILIFTGLIGWSMRLSTDLSIILPLFIACVVGLLFISHNKITTTVIAVLVVVLAVPNIISYSQYNSAIKPIDKEVISYVNNLEGKYYSCSSEVAPWIYGLYLNKTYKEGALPCIIRNELMSSRTSPDAIDYWWNNGAMGYVRQTENRSFLDYDLDKAVKFNDNDLVVYIVENN